MKQASFTDTPSVNRAKYLINLYNGFYLFSRTTRMDVVYFITLQQYLEF